MLLIERQNWRYTATCVETCLDPAWDELVEATAGGDLTQTTLWAASRQRLGFRSYHIIIVTDSDQVQVGGCLMYAKRLAPGFWAGSIPRGPLLFVDGPRAASAVVREVAALSRQRGVRFLVLQPPEGATELDEAIMAAGFRPGVPSVAPEATMRLDLHRSDEELLGSMNSMRRRNIRKALCAGFEVREDRDIGVFHRLHLATAERQGFAPVSLENLQAQWDTLAPTAMCTMFIARYDGTPTAGLWLTRFAGTVTFKLAGWDATSTAPPHANEALHWAAIRWARTQGAHTYDLGGFDRRTAELIITDEPLADGFRQSPSYFKLGFGGTPVLLPRARFVFTHRFADVALGRAAQHLFTSPGLRGFVQRLRNG